VVDLPSPHLGETANHFGALAVLDPGVTSLRMALNVSTPRWRSFFVEEEGGCAISLFSPRSGDYGEAVEAGKTPTSWPSGCDRRASRRRTWRRCRSTGPQPLQGQIDQDPACRLHRDDAFSMMRTLPRPRRRCSLFSVLLHLGVIELAAGGQIRIESLGWKTRMLMSAFPFRCVLLVFADFSPSWRR